MTPDQQARGEFRHGSLLDGNFGLRRVNSQRKSTVDASYPLLALAGLLVGFGARLGSGCTSGHGVCGIGRGSPRSLVATGTFMAVAILTVLVVRHVTGA